MFDKAISQLLKQHSNNLLENSGNTVVVVGGVHWLASHHLNVLKQALKRLVVCRGGDRDQIGWSVMGTQRNRVAISLTK